MQLLLLFRAAFGRGDLGCGQDFGGYAVDLQFPMRCGRFGYVGFPDQLLLTVQYGDPKTLESDTDAAVGAIPDDDLLDRGRFREFDLPPRVLVFFGVGCRFGLVVVTVRVAIDGQFCRAVVIDAGLGGLTFGCNILLPVENLDFRQRQELGAVDNLDAYKLARDGFCISGRDVLFPENLGLAQFGCVCGQLGF